MFQLSPQTNIYHQENEILPFLGIQKDIHKILSIKDKYKSVSRIKENMMNVVEELYKNFYFSVKDHRSSGNYRTSAYPEYNWDGSWYIRWWKNMDLILPIQDALRSFLGHGSSQPRKHTLFLNRHNRNIHNTIYDKMEGETYKNKVIKLLLELEQAQNNDPQKIFTTLTKINTSYKPWNPNKKESNIYEQYKVLDNILGDIHQIGRKDWYSLPEYEHIIQEYDVYKLSNTTKEKLREIVFGFRYMRNQLNAYENYVKKWSEYINKEYALVKLTALLHNISVHKIQYEVQINIKDDFIHIVPTHEGNFKTLWIGRNQDNIKNAKSIAWFQFSNKWVPIIVQPYEKSGLNISNQKIYIHERRHVRNQFFMNEKINAIAQAKDEIIAWLSEKQKISDIKRNLTNPKWLYTYWLTGRARENHVQEVTWLLNEIRKCDVVNLDALALFPNNRSEIFQNQKKFATGKMESEIVRVRR